MSSSVSEPRPVSDQERALLDFFLGQAFPGAEVLRHQMAGLLVDRAFVQPGRTRVRFVVSPDAARWGEWVEIPVETHVRGPYPPRKVCVYVEDGLLDMLEVGDFGGATVPDLPAPDELETPWCHRPPAPLPDAVCAHLSAALTAIAPKRTQVRVTPTAIGFHVQVRFGRFGASHAGMGSANDDDVHSVVEIMRFVQKQIAEHAGQAWPARTPLRSWKTDVPSSGRPSLLDDAGGARLVAARHAWEEQLPTPQALLEYCTIRAWYGPENEPIVILPLPAP